MCVRIYMYTSVLLCIKNAKTAADQITMRLRNHSGYDRHVAITTSITNVIATSIIPDITTSVLQYCLSPMLVRVYASGLPRHVGGWRFKPLSGQAQGTVLTAC